MKVTNKSRNMTFYACIGTENPCPPANITIPPLATVEVQDQEWAVIVTEITKSGLKPDDYNLCCASVL